MGHAAQTWVEVWPVAADKEGIWLVTPDAIIDGPTDADDGPTASFVTLGRILDALGYPQRDWEDPDRPGVLTAHSTSWRGGDRDMDGLPGATILTWIVALEVPLGAYVPDLELVNVGGKPVSLRLFDQVGNPAPHGPGQPPTPRRIDVLFHGLRHLAFLVKTDSGERRALGPLWRRHLEHLEPALAGMYLDEQAELA